MSTPSFRLEADWNPEISTPGQLTISLVNTGDAPVSGFTLAVTSLFRIKPDSPIEGAQLLDQLSNYHLLAPEDGFVLEPGSRWSIVARQISHTLRHYTYGPKSAAITLSDGTMVLPEIVPMTLKGEPGAPIINTPERQPLADGETTISVIPFPAKVDVSGQRDLPAAIGFGAGPETARSAFEATSRLAERLFPGETLFGDSLAVKCADNRALRHGAYDIAFGDDVTLSASDMDGFRHGFITLAQILRGARRHPEDFTFPASGIISDAPRFGWRGSHLDVARQVYTVSEIKAFLDTMAWNKLNRFHIHLNDDEGWRLDVPEYPQLAEKAAWRGPGEILPPLLGSPFERHGIIYRADDVREVVDHGLAIGIETVPEIDIPGHCYCVLKALPHLADPEETGIYRSVQYFPNNALNPALDETYVFLEAVIKTLVELFPAKWIHIGGDEVADAAWSGSPQAKSMQGPNGWEGTFALQSYFLKRIQSLLSQYGKETGAWEEAALGGGVNADRSYLVAWKKSESGRELALQGYDVVLSPAEYAYFDMAQSNDWWEPGASWAGTVSLETCYSFTPAHDWPDDAQSKLIGVQSCLWCENLADRKLFDHLVYPRLSAIAETSWTPAATKDFRRFMAIQSLMPKARLG
ncbi:beta-N-acetylhexosaminidase [Pelagibacterium lentulum]|uniref:beta-N-acetylhexosaminidase n=1 Tax=Pelagibacterium lentulum TaxID=2029865 RepID=A0A916RFA2_9HYPH|nr:beta-N-acetylhexosaminidase [Pelagibacterium lentulum]GGA53965.1 beta-N-acetylhexosaminidase [Pelagibacterium lentulum]